MLYIVQNKVFLCMQCFDIVISDTNMYHQFKVIIELLVGDNPSFLRKNTKENAFMGSGCYNC